MRSELIVLISVMMLSVQALLQLPRKCGWQGASSVQDLVGTIQNREPLDADEIVDLVGTIQNREPLDADEIVEWRKGEGVLRDPRIQLDL
ncbi:unnamed protein product [Strongylus vulgaris]|uniref:Uncharacterized protein n=1 Tax=Strongylus vulgaris TaxID=40348 RepID=A0A3P7ISB3_STRVU|nr:unnamed protein product [Strongylus vulgaris]